MREVVLRVPRLAVEDILDRLLPIVPSGVREVPAGRHVDLQMRGPGIPALSEITRATGRWPYKLSEREVPDDWHERRLADYHPNVISGRVVVRPEWAPAHADRSVIDIALREGAAFGGGGHPTTRTCLERLLELKPTGAFADLGCGSGVLAVLAAKLGWAPVVAVDVEPGSIDATLANAELNGVTVEARVLDLTTDAAPAADAFAANVPPPIHAAIAAGLSEPVGAAALLSGFGEPEADDVVRAYAARGLRARERIDVHGWTVVVLGAR